MDCSTFRELDSSRRQIRIVKIIADQDNRQLIRLFLRHIELADNGAEGSDLSFQTASTQRYDNGEHSSSTSHSRPLDATEDRERSCMAAGASTGMAPSEATSLPEQPKYTALSYTWGPEEPDYCVELMDEGGARISIRVRQNLHNFLGLARSQARSAHHDSSQDWYWIDQICIDQTNVPERNHQVAMMARVYSEANVVRVWIPIPENRSKNIAEYVAYVESGDFGMPGKSLARVWKRHVAAHYAALRAIVQEMLSARRVMIQLGDSVCEGEAVKSWLMPLMDNDWVAARLGRRLRVEQGVFAHVSELILASGDTMSFLGMSDLAEGLQCADFHDKIYALRGIVRYGGSQLIPDYSLTRTELHRQVVTYDLPGMVDDEYWLTVREMVEQIAELWWTWARILGVTADTMEQTLPQYLHLTLPDIGYSNSDLDELESVLHDPKLESLLLGTSVIPASGWWRRQEWSDDSEEALEYHRDYSRRNVRRVLSAFSELCRRCRIWLQGWR